MDRDLGIAGRVITASKSASSSSSSETTTYVPHLVHLDRPLVRIPTVAIHLDRTQNEKFFYNQESGMQAILGLVSEQVSTPATVVAAIDPSPPDSSPKSPLDTQANHHPRLLELVAEELSAQGIKGASGSSVQVGDIYDFDLSLVDVQPPTLGGANEEFIFSARLDNLFSTFCAVEGLADSLLPPSAASSSSSSSSAENADLPDGSIRVVACWDNEEIGSASAYGAESNFLEAIIQRVVGDPAKFDQSIANSFLISCDMGHALHPAPDHAGKHQAEHRPLMNQGPAVKTNAKIRYASTAPTTFLLRRIAATANVPLQEFSVRNDMPCGSTIGPLCSKLGLRTVDIGCVQLAMHSIRETAGADDVGPLIELLKAFFSNFQSVDRSLVMDD
ncbi:MAG: hypothetical protein CYPHOPRED_003712 [Cyphobasidiales sp. Tagirdzhanova-0007]|nr:MAG: hypothetical protein CYPHOPRED_003712 [Cyphobasidiales sp. Tagirdzhanova-0007]